MKIKDTIQALLVFTLFVLSVLCMIQWVIDSAYDRGFDDCLRRVNQAQENGRSK